MDIDTVAMDTVGVIIKVSTLIITYIVMYTGGVTISASTIVMDTGTAAMGLALLSRILVLLV